MAISKVSARSFNAGFSDLFFEDEEFSEEIDRLVSEFGKNVLNAIESLKKKKNVSSNRIDSAKLTVRVLIQDDREVIELPPTGGEL